MILGRAIEDQKKWHKVFVVFPRKLIDRRWAVFELVERISYYSNEIPSNTPYSLIGEWCYRAIE